ncbi:MAG: phosphoenolpyruvate carboxylase, partial [Coxiellaceae bacterium]|nr:phosphoenolpyruvate carboxylase [Coxiellaceae bacterium]
MDKHFKAYQHLVTEKYKAFNTLFLRLPFYGVPEAGMALPEFAETCEQGLQGKKTPIEIVESFFQGRTDQDIYQQLFLFLQFVERQIVLFDALEDCAYHLTHDLDGPGSLTSAIHEINDVVNLDDYQTRIVLTAHPTQFYSPYVLNIIEDLSTAIHSEDIASIKLLLLQMGKTPFLGKKQPTPLDEAEFLITYLAGIFYPTVSHIHRRLQQATHRQLTPIRLGFWPGADRDGNPNVTANITLAVADALKKSILACYQQDLHQLRRRLTFKHVIEKMQSIEEKLPHYASPQALLNDLQHVRVLIHEQDDDLFIEHLDAFITRVQSFGFYFASLDLRQDSSAHEDFINRYLPGYITASHDEKLAMIDTAMMQPIPNVDVEHDCIAALKTLPIIQAQNGVEGMHRYIISNTQAAHHVTEILLLLKWAGLESHSIQLDIV